MSEHISVIVARAHQRANAILRCFVSRDRNLLVKAFKVYVMLGLFLHIIP